MGNISVIQALLAVLPDLEAEERDGRDPIPFAVDVLDAMSAVSDKGNPSVISALVERTHHVEVWVRDAALRALENVADVGNQSAIAAAVRCIRGMDDEDWDDDVWLPVRGTALQTAKVIAEAKGDVTVVAAVVERIKHDKFANVRLEALDTLRRVAVKGDSVAISACVECLRDEDSKIQGAAWEGMEHLAVKGCRSVIEACLASLDDEREEVCRSAAELLGRVAPKGHVASAGCLAAQTLQSRSQDKAVGQAILHSLSLIASRGNRTAVSAIMHFIASAAAHGEQSSSTCVRWFAAFSALQDVAAKDDAAVISFIASYLGSKIPGVREAASYSLYMLVNGSTIDTLCAWLAAVREQLYGPCSDSTDNEIARAILKDVLKEQGWLPRRRLRTKSFIAPHYVKR